MGHLVDLITLKNKSDSLSRFGVLHLVLFILFTFFSTCTFNPSLDKNKMFNGFLSILASTPPTYNLEGSLTSMTKQHGKFILSTQSDKNYVYTTENDQVFRRYEVSIEGCTQEKLDQIFINCKLLAVGYDGTTYAILASREECQSNQPCILTQHYFGIFKDLDSVVVKPTTITGYTLNTNSFIQSNNFIYENGVFHYYTYISTNMYYYKNGSWYFIDTYSLGGMGSSCSYLYLDRSITPSCSDKYYYNGSAWVANNNTSLYPMTVASISDRYYATYTIPNGSNVDYQIKLGSGSIQSGFTFSLVYTLTTTGGGAQIEFMKNRFLGITAESTTSPPGPDVKYLNSVYSANGSSFTSQSKTIVPPSGSIFTQPFLYKASNNYFYFGVNSYSSNIYKTLLYRSKDGIEWNQVTKL